MVCLTVCLSYCVIVCLFSAKSAAKILLFLHICKQNPKNMQNLPISAFFCFIVLYSAFIFHFCRIFAAVHPFSFHSAFPFLYPPSLADWKCRFPFALLPFSSSLSLASGSDPDKKNSNSPFRPENLIILTFPSPKICIYQKFCVPLHRKVRIGVPDGRKRSASGGESGGIGCPFI